MTQGLLSLCPPYNLSIMDNKKSSLISENQNQTLDGSSPAVVDADTSADSDAKQQAEASKDAKAHKETEGKKRGISKRTIWTIKITIITFVLSFFFSFLTEISTSKANIIVAAFVLVLLVVISIVFDGIGVAATSCDLAPLLSMAAKKTPGAKVAVILVKNAEKVSNICADVIGDICGIISGACSVAIVMKINFMDGSYWLNIIMSAIVAAVTVGGKAFNKDISIKNSKEVILLASRFISIFYHPKDERKAKKAQKKLRKEKKQ